MKDNIPGFEYISKTGRTPVRIQRVGAKDSEFDAEECEEVSFVNVGAKVHTRQATSVQELIQRLATNLLS